MSGWTKRVTAQAAAVGVRRFVGGQQTAELHVICTPPMQQSLPAAAFVKAVCIQMAADRPDLYLVNMRTSRIFLDTFEMIAWRPLSPRAREGATKSMPLTWGQVKGGFRPETIPGPNRAEPPEEERRLGW
jgi:DNA primase